VLCLTAFITPDHTRTPHATAPPNTKPPIQQADVDSPEFATNITLEKPNTMDPIKSMLASWIDSSGAVITDHTPWVKVLLLLLLSDKLYKL